VLLILRQHEELLRCGQSSAVVAHLPFADRVHKLDATQNDRNTVHDLTQRRIGFKVLTGQGATINTTKAAGKLVFGIFAALAEFERELMSERTKAGLASARARGRKGGAPFKMTAAKLRLAMSAMGQVETHVGDLCRELGVTRQTLYRHVGPGGKLRRDGKTLLNRVGGSVAP
jgi:DNA invertase Pin-like site-specific DNA recombinase